MRGMPTKLEATVQRYQCQGCSRTFLQPLGGVHASMRMTERCEAHIIKRALTATNAAVAREVGLDEKTVRRVASKGLAAISAHQHGSIPRVLGIDETRIGGKLRLVLADLEHKRLVDMLTDREPSTLSDWIASRAGISKTEVVVIDLWRPYCTVIQAELPRATVVADKFHVLRLASDALDQVRKRRLSARSGQEGLRTFTRSKFALLKSRRNLTDTQKQDLEQWLREDADIAAAYQAKEAFYAIFDMPRNEAIRAFDDFHSAVPDAVRKEFRQLLAKMKVWRSEMLAILDHPRTNAYTESLNGAIQTMARNGRGYSFDVLRARVLHGHADAAKKELRITHLLKNHGNPCGHCGTLCSASDMSEVTLPPSVAGRPAVLAMVCEACEPKFNAENLKAKRHQPTRKSG